MACPLCLEVQDEPHQHHGGYGRIVESGDHVLYQNDGMFCVPSLGPLNGHHLLIVPTIHCTSTAAVSDSVPAAELRFLKSQIRHFNKLQFDLETVFFEHGTGTVAKLACACIEHAHLHALGTNVDLLEVLRKHYDFREMNGDVAGNQDLAASGYYYYEHSSSQAVVCTQMLEPQFFRIMFWRSFGQWAPWNWRLHYNLPLVQDVVVNYRDFQESALTERCRQA